MIDVRDLALALGMDSATDCTQHSWEPGQLIGNVQLKIYPETFEAVYGEFVTDLWFGLLALDLQCQTSKPNT